MNERSIDLGDGFKLSLHRVHAVYDLRDRDPSRECLVAYYSFAGDQVFHRIAQRSFSELSRELTAARKGESFLE